MSEISILAIDLAKNSFQVCAVRGDGTIVSNRAVSRARLYELLAKQEGCIVAMEACATSHHWGRVAVSYGHNVRLIPAQYVKPFVKRQKNDHLVKKVNGVKSTFLTVFSSPENLGRW